jgi:hypothetical protein
MPSSHAVEIVVDFLLSEEFPDQLIDSEAEPDLDLPPLPPPRPNAA